jgi:predicted amidophosphoribosyltransferase
MSRTPAPVHREATVETVVGADCRVCGRTVVGDLPVCFCCRTVADQLALPLVPLVAVCEYRVGDRVHRRLRDYKDAAVPEVRDRCRRELAAGLGEWLAERGTGLGRQLAEWAVVTTVPSSHRPGRAPAEALVDEVPELASRHLRLLARGRGGAGHLRADRAAFGLAPGVDRAGLVGLAVLVFDDTTTTGAAAQSAAAALRLAGARVVAALAVGRALAPLPSPPAGGDGS